MLRVDFRTQFFQNDPNALLQLHPGDFIFVEFQKTPQPISRMLHIMPNGTAEWVDKRAFATGSGDLFAYALLNKYHIAELNLYMASVLAAKVIQEGIEVGSYGLGPPITVCQVGDKGVKRLSEEEIAQLNETTYAS